MINSLSTSLPIAPLVINHPLKANLTCNGRWLTRMELVKPFLLTRKVLIHLVLTILRDISVYLKITINKISPVDGLKDLFYGIAPSI